MEVWEEYIYIYRYTVTTRMTCIKMGSDESHFNVSLIVRDKVTRQCPQTTTFEEKGEPKRYWTEVLPLTSLPPSHLTWWYKLCLAMPISNVTVVFKLALSKCVVSLFPHCVRYMIMGINLRCSGQVCKCPIWTSGRISKILQRKIYFYHFIILLCVFI